MGRVFRHLFYGLWSRPALNKRCVLVGLKPNRDLAYMNERFEAGQLVPVIDGPYTLDEAPDAFRHFGAGQHKGKIPLSTMRPPAVPRGEASRITGAPSTFGANASYRHAGLRE